MPNISRHINKHGFTLVELMVVIAIMAIISTVVLSNGNHFNDSLLVSGVAEDVSLAVRDVQSYGSSVSETSLVSGNFSDGYGIAFNKTYPGYILEFVDTNANKIYDGDPTCVVSGSECLKKVYLRNAVTIHSLCAVGSSSMTQCLSTFGAIDVTFIRPSLSATITVLDTSGNVIAGPWTSASVVLSSNGGSLKTITMNTTGQVSIQ